MSSIVLRERNWGRCYISDGEAGLLIGETVLEIIVLVLLYVFSRAVGSKMKELQVIVDLKSVFA